MAKIILNSRYILHVVIALSQLLMEEGGLAEYIFVLTLALLLVYREDEVIVIVDE